MVVNQPISLADRSNNSDTGLVMKHVLRTNVDSFVGPTILLDQLLRKNDLVSEDDMLALVSGTSYGTLHRHHCSLIALDRLIGLYSPPNRLVFYLFESDLSLFKELSHLIQRAFEPLPEQTLVSLLERKSGIMQQSIVSNHSIEFLVDSDLIVDSIGVNDDTFELISNELFEAVN